MVDPGSMSVSSITPFLSLKTVEELKVIAVASFVSEVSEMELADISATVARPVVLLRPVERVADTIIRVDSNFVPLTRYPIAII